MPDCTPPLIVHVVHALEGGGTERTLISLLREFDPSSFRHTVVTLREAGSLSSQLPDHVACRPLGTCGRSRSVGIRLAALTRAWHASVIHARGIGCWADAAVAGVLTRRSRLVLGFHGTETGGPLDRAQRRKARWGLWAGARFTSVSESGGRRLQQEAGVPGARITVLSNGVNLERFAAADGVVRQAARNEWCLDDSAFVVGIVGSLTPVKRHSTLISAVARAAECVPDLRLVIVGDGPLREALGEQARAEGITHRVRFTGHRDDVPTLLAGMDAYVCCSEAEGMNNALLEAMAAGLPVIASNVGDNPVLVRSEVEGLIVKPGCVASLTGAVTLLACQGELRDRLGVAARTRACQFSFERVVRAYEHYYRTLTTAGHPAAFALKRWYTPSEKTEAVM